MTPTHKRRIWGWMVFDWASQPYYTLGLTFIFGPYFAIVAMDYFVSQGADGETARAQSQSVWAMGQTVAGLVIAFTAPFLGAFADNTGRKQPWIALFSVIYIVAAAALWFMKPDTSSLYLFLLIFYIGFIAAESALNFINAYLPSMGTDEEVGKVSGSGAAFGYWGGLISVIIMLVFFAEMGDSGRTIAGLEPIFGLDADQREGTRFVGPFIAIWYALFIIPFFMWVKDNPEDAGQVPKMSKVVYDLVTTLKRVGKRKSTATFLLGGMFYRDALNALYAFGGVYATLVLGWTVAELGPFAIASIISAAVFTFVGGRFDSRFGPKPVIIFCILLLIVVCIFTVSLSREALFGVPLAEGSALPDIIFFTLGCIIGGAGGALYAASRSLMVRHGHPDRPTETFGLFALSGKATAFLAPLLISVFTAATGNVQLGYLPLIFLFLLGLILLVWVNKDGDRDEWVASQQLS